MIKYKAYALASGFIITAIAVAYNYGGHTARKQEQRICAATVADIRNQIASERLAFAEAQAAKVKAQNQQLLAVERNYQAELNTAEAVRTRQVGDLNNAITRALNENSCRRLDDTGGELLYSVGKLIDSVSGRQPAAAEPTAFTNDSTPAPRNPPPE